MGGRRRKEAGRKCRNCNTFNELDARYCGQCGNVLIGSPPGRGKEKAGSKRREPSYWMITAIIALIFSVGLAVKAVLYTRPGIQQGQKMSEVSSLTGYSMERQLQVVASNFRCACGGCGELPLIECDCDMPRGAREEKAFIREKLGEGLTIEQVIQLVEREYGLKVTG